MTEPIQCAILGSGVAGLSAAVYAARDGLGVIIAGGPLEGGLLTRTGTVENFPGFPEGITGFELISRMRRQAERFGARFLHASAEWIDREAGGIMHVHLSGGTVLDAETVILATGAAPRMLGLEAEQRLLGHGVSVCANCDAPFFRGVPVAVAGGGDTALEEAVMLSRFAAEVHVVHRRNRPTASRVLIDRAESAANIVWHPESEITGLLGEDVLTGIRIRDRNTRLERILDCAGCFIALGHIPETRLVGGLAELTESGCVRCFGGTARTSVPGLFAAGDCADCRYRQAVTAAGTGAAAALDAAEYLRRKHPESGF